MSQNKILIPCSQCGESQWEPALVQSTNCRSCGTYLSFENLVIDGVYAKEVRTLGDVEITKRGVLHGISIQCRNLIVKGRCEASVRATGKIEFLNRGTSKINSIKAQKVIIGRHCDLNIRQTLEANEVTVAGKLTGVIRCEGPVTLERPACVTGDIQMHSIDIHAGAKHHGQVLNLALEEPLRVEESPPLAS